MFSFVGDKIKRVAEIFCYIGIVLSIIGGSLVILDTNSTLYYRYRISPLVLGLLIMVIGPVVSWLSSLAFYGFGQLIENSAILVEEATRKPPKS